MVRASVAKAPAVARASADRSEGIDAGHQWFFDGTEHVDPAKEARAQAIRLASTTTTLAAEYARQGKDWENELRQRAKEKQLMAELGLADTEAVAQTNSGRDTDVEKQNTAPRR